MTESHRFVRPDLKGFIMSSLDIVLGKVVD